MGSTEESGEGMKTYVNYFGDAKSTREKFGSDVFIDGKSYTVFGDTPEPWKLSLIEAESKRIMLKRHDVKDNRFPDHTCEFEIEKVGADEYAIVCNDHPFATPKGEA